MPRIPFNKIHFGFASAEVESAEQPELLLDAFLDPHNVISELVDSRRFLVLGFKGAGKSALGFHLYLQSIRQPRLFVTPHFLADFSYRTLGSIVREDVETELRLPKAWSWLLLLSLFTSASSDEGVVPSDPTAYHRTLRVFREEGLIPTDNLGDVLGRSASRDLQLTIANISVAGSRRRDRQDPSLRVLVESLRKLVLTLRTESRHILVIDGLDEILLRDELQRQALTALILEAARLNQVFRQGRAPFKICVLCRTDIFERLPGPNQNKIRQDLAAELDWCEEATAPERSRLVQLANLRAKLADPNIEDIFDAYFPQLIQRKSPAKYLLEYTRHTPRDFLQLLVYLQRANHSGRLSYGEISAGIRSYAEKFFLPEIRDELQGAFARDELDCLVEALRQFHKHEFAEEEFCRFAVKRQFFSEQEDLGRILRALYQSSAIGNIYVTPQEQRRYSFRYRNPQSSYNNSDLVVVHKSVRRALQL